MTMKITDLGEIIWENDKSAVIKSEKDSKLCLYVIPKKDGKYYYPLGFMLGSNALYFMYKTDDWFKK